MSKAIMLKDRTHELIQATSVKFGSSMSEIVERAIGFFIEVNQVGNKVFGNNPDLENLYEKTFGSEKTASLKILERISTLEKEISEIKYNLQIKK